jgi:hypothetical protein
MAPWNDVGRLEIWRDGLGRDTHLAAGPIDRHGSGGYSMGSMIAAIRDAGKVTAGLSSATARGGSASGSMRLAAQDVTGYSRAAAGSTGSGTRDIWSEMEQLAATHRRDTGSADAAGDLVHGVKEIARKTSETPRRINDAIHWVKNEGKIGGSEKNPDVHLDLATGELYPGDKRTGAAGPDSFGNLFDALQMMPQRFQH